MARFLFSLPNEDSFKEPSSAGLQAAAAAAAAAAASLID
jgi:hypothetical protein